MRITTRVQSDVSSASPFVNAFGWRVHVSAAWLALEHLYYVTGPAAGLAVDQNQSFGIRVARAHPGHYDAGMVLAEFSEAVGVDLSAKGTVLGTNEGVTGLARSAIVEFGELSSHPGAAVLLEAVARRDGVEIPFAARVGRAAIVNPTSGLPEVEGCLLVDGAIDQDGAVLLDVETAVWVDQVDFAVLTPRADGERVELEPNTPPHNAFRRGVSKAISYRFSYSSQRP